MTARGFLVACMHEGTEISDRQRIMDEYRKGSIRILITTDMEIDIQGINLVINYDLPTKEKYIKRISNCTGFGRGGALSLVLIEEFRALNDIAKFYKFPLEEAFNVVEDLTS